MSAGKPTVAIDFACARDVIIDGETGYLVTPPRLEEMAERILCLRNNEAICYEMGVTAQKHIASLYRELSTH